MTLRIAQVAPLWENIPPPKYGGTERVVHYLTEGLVIKNHDVTLFACGSSQTKAKLFSVYPRPLYRDNIPWTSIMYPLLNVTAAFDRQHEFDIIHLHLNKSSDYLGLPFAQMIKNKVVITLHFPYPILQKRPENHAVFQKYKDLNYVSISKSQRTGGENLNWVATVYNGVDANFYSLSEKSNDYFIWVGKFNPNKGAKEAIMAAKKMGVKLLMAGTVDTMEKPNYDYYHQEIKPLVDGQTIIELGELNDAEKKQAYSQAKAFLNPIHWQEPFGLVMTEALSTGCPVISYSNGAAPEIIKHKETGFLVDETAGVDGLCEAIKEICSMSNQEYLQMRRNCHQHIEENFTIEKMVDEYEKVYEKLVHSS